MGASLFGISPFRFYAIAHIRVTIGLGKTLGEWGFRDSLIGRSADYRAASRQGIVMRSSSAGQVMKSVRFDAVAWSAAFWLPAFMAALEYVLRIAFAQPGEDSFFPISLVASGISLSVTATLVPSDALETWNRWPSARAASSAERFESVISAINFGVFASLAGVLLWIYLLLASFSEAVRTMLPMYPFPESLAYYVLCLELTRRRRQVMR
jgi:hypothetical protein